jgi:ABC-type multidrug transport system ATPase subunit/NAD(P)-dependent dehydrogenase (short-subunit alcohol dehydrogenase family)
MGRAAAIAFAREGADVAINHLPAEEEDAREVIELMKAEGRTALSIPGDIRDEPFCKRLVDEAVRGLGGLDILVSNAGRQQSRASILDISTEDFDATMKTNIYAPFWIIKAALPHMPPGSAIIGTASEQAYDPSPDLYDYAQTKAATMNYVKSLAKQLASKGIRVNAVAPGPIWTPLQISGGATQEKVEKFGGQTPLGRPFTFSSRCQMRALPRARSTAPLAEQGSPNRPGTRGGRRAGRAFNRGLTRPPGRLIRRGMIPPAPCILKVERLEKSFGEVRAVDGVSFHVAPGEIVGLVGPNGAGKTTTINMILGVLEPSGGRIEIEGVDLAIDRSKALSCTNFAAVYAPLPGNLTVEQNLRVFGMLYAVRDLSARIEKLLAVYDLLRYRRTKAGVLSSGEQTRLSLAKAMLNLPRLLLLDEPTASIDPSNARDIRADIAKFVDNGLCGVLWTSHNMYEVQAVCDRVLFLSHGRIVLEGDPKTLPEEHGAATLDDLFVNVAQEALHDGGGR